MLTGTLIVAVLMLLVCAIAWALSASSGNYAGAAKARTGAAAAWVDWLISVGSSF